MTAKELKERVLKIINDEIYSMTKQTIKDYATDDSNKLSILSKIDGIQLAQLITIKKSIEDINID